MGFLYGLMGEVIRDNLSMIKKMALESCNGVMGEFMRGSFMMEFSMEKANIRIRMGK